MTKKTFKSSKILKGCSARQISLPARHIGVSSLQPFIIGGSPMHPQITIKPNGKCVLHLPGKTYKPYRYIGTIDADTFYTTRSSEKNQKFNNSNSIGFCYNLVRDYRELIKLVCVNYDAKALWTTPAAIMKFGTFKNYVRNDLEMQIFLGLEHFKHSPSEASIEQEMMLEQIRTERSNCGHEEPEKSDDDQIELFAVA